MIAIEKNLNGRDGNNYTLHKSWGNYSGAYIFTLIQDDGLRGNWFPTQEDAHLWLRGKPCRMNGLSPLPVEVQPANYVLDEERTDAITR